MNRFAGSRMSLLAWLLFWVKSVAVRIDFDDKHGDLPALTSGALSDEEERRVDEALMTLLAARHSSSNKLASDFPDAQAAVALGLADDLRALRHSRTKHDEDVDGQAAAESASKDEDSAGGSKEAKREPKVTPTSQRADKGLNEVKTRDKDKAKPTVMEKGEAVEQSTESVTSQKEAEEAVSAAASVVSRNAVRASTASTAAVAEADKLSDKLRAATASAAEAKQLTEKLRDDAIVAARAREKHSHKGRRHTKESDGAKDEANSSDLAVYRDLLLRYEAMRLRQDLQKVDTGSAKSKGSLLRRLERLELERDIQDSTLDDKRRRSAIELNREAIRIRQARKALLGKGVTDVNLVGDGSHEHELIKGGSQLQLSAETVEEEEKAHCLDDDARCPAWKAAKECSHNREWMQEHCRKSCETCPGDVAYLSMKGKGSNRQVKMKKMHIKELLDFLSDSASQSQTIASSPKKASTEGTKPDDDGVVVGVFAKKEHLKQLSNVHAAPQPESKKQADEPVAETVKVVGKKGVEKHEPTDVAATNNHPGRQESGKIVAEVVQLAKDIEGGNLLKATKPTKREDDDKRSRGERGEEGAKQKKEPEVVAAGEDATENNPASAVTKPSRAAPQAVKENKLGLKGTDLLKERWHEDQLRERPTDADAHADAERIPKGDSQEQNERALKGSRIIDEEAESVATVLDDINENNMGLESTNLLKHRRQERSQKRADEANAKTRTTTQKDKEKAQVNAVEASVDKRGQGERDEEGGKNMNEEAELVKSVVADEDDKDDNAGLEDAKAVKEHQQDVKLTDGGHKDTKASKEHSPEKVTGNDAEQDQQQKRSKKEHMVVVGRSKEDTEGQDEREDQVQKHVVEETEVISKIPDDRFQKVADHENGRLVAGLPKEKRGQGDREKEERSATKEDVETKSNEKRVREEREIEAEAAAPLVKDTRGQERNSQDDESTFGDRSMNASAKRKKRPSSNDMRLNEEEREEGVFSAKGKNSSADDSEHSRAGKVQGGGAASPELKAKTTHTEHLSKIEVDENGKRAKVDTWQVTQTEGWVDPVSNSTVTKITEDTTVLVGDSPRSKKLLEEVKREQKERLKDLKVQHKQSKKQLKSEHEKNKAVDGSTVAGVVESKEGADGDGDSAIRVLLDSRKVASSDAAEQTSKKKQTQKIKKSGVPAVKGLKKATSGETSTDSNVSSDRGSTNLHRVQSAASGESAELDEAVASSTDAAH